MRVAGFHLPRYINLDYVHIFHLGYGMDIGASSIVLLAKLGHYGTMRSFPKRLDEAYERFDAWCKEVQRTSSILRFSKEGFDMKDWFLASHAFLSQPCPTSRTTTTGRHRSAERPMTRA